MYPVSCHPCCNHHHHQHHRHHRHHHHHHHCIISLAKAWPVWMPSEGIVPTFPFGPNFLCPQFKTTFQKGRNNTIWIEVKKIAKVVPIHLLLFFARYLNCTSFSFTIGIICWAFSCFFSKNINFWLWSQDFLKKLRRRKNALCAIRGRTKIY